MISWNVAICGNNGIEYWHNRLCDTDRIPQKQTLVFMVCSWGILYQSHCLLLRNQCCFVYGGCPVPNGNGGGGGNVFCKTEMDWFMEFFNVFRICHNRRFSCANGLTGGLLSQRLRAGRYIIITSKEYLKISSLQHMLLQLFGDKIHPYIRGWDSNDKVI